MPHWVLMGLWVVVGLGILLAVACAGKDRPTQHYWNYERGDKDE